MNAENLHSQSVILEPGWTTFYLHAPNSFKLHVGKQSCEHIFVKAKYGTIKKDSRNCEYYYWNNNCQAGRDRLIIYTVVNQDSVAIDTIIVKLSDEALKSIPIGFHGRCYTSGIQKCPLNKKEIVMTTIDSTSYYPGLFARLLNWDTELYYKISRYSIEQSRDGKVLNSEKNIPGKDLTDEWVQIMQTANKNDEFRFYDIFLIFDDCEKSFVGPTIVIE